jgi:BirA family biotin operon repressor/biotin-[acetyl-CoA-carboxylase] ligase
VDSPPWLVHLDSCSSTSTWALQHLDDLRHGSAVFTRRQSAGRGREGRSWLAPAGTLTASLVLDAPYALQRPLALAAGLACIHALSDLAPAVADHLAIKWPNDVLLRDRKLAGILCEGAGQRMVVGIGLNLAADLPADLPATSLHLHAAPPDDLVLLASLRGYLLEAAGLCTIRGLGPLLPQLRARDALLGRSLTIETRTGRLDGQGGGIDEHGHLLVVVPGGGIASVEAGHLIAW